MTTKTEAPMMESMEDVLGSIDVEYATIEGFTKDTTVRIISLTAGDMIEFAEANEGEAKREAGLRLIAKSLVNSKGVRFAADESKSIPVFRSKAHKTTERIVKEILKLNGIVLKDDAQKKADEKAKND